MPPERDGVSTYYLSINRNKRSIVLDFRDADDVGLVRELLRRADVAIENFKPGGLAKFGLDYDAARTSSTQRLVYLSISGFGTAEGAWLPGYDLVVQAVSGLMSLTGEPDGPAYRAGISVFDVITGLHGTIGVLAALRQRDETGVGQHVEVNLLSSALSGARQPDRRLHGGRRRARSGWATPTRASTRTSRCRRRTATSSSPRPTTASSAPCARCSGSPRSPTTSGSVSTPTARRTATELHPILVAASSPSGRPTICSSPSTRPVCRAARSTRS